MISWNKQKKKKELCVQQTVHFIADDLFRARMEMFEMKYQNCNCICLCN